jgi:hypothetical protein
MKRVSIYLLTLLLLASTTLALGTVQADTSVLVTVIDPYSQTNGNKGLASGGYWVGEIPITFNDGTNIYETQSYCINFDRNIYVGSTYSATITAAADNAEWRAVSYLLTWNNPADNNQAAADQTAIWRLLNQTRGTNYYKESWLDQSIDDAGNAASNQAYGKDVVRQGDQFNWISPISNNMSVTQANAGQTVSFIAKLSSAEGTARPNVRILFNASLNFAGNATPLNSTYVSTSETFTDNQGIAQVNVKVPSDASLGATIAVEASTQGVWPQRYIDVTDPSTQDLIGLGTSYQLTLSTNLAIYGFIQVLPESTLGTLAAFGAVGAGFTVWVKFKHPKNKNKQ